MTTIYSNPKLLTFHDPSAPQRGQWIIYSHRAHAGFAACHETRNSHGIPCILEEIFLDSMLDVRAFSSQLFSLGWHTSD